jgi:hypothetical protein
VELHQVGTEDRGTAGDALHAMNEHPPLGFSGEVDEAEAVFQDEEDVSRGVVLDRKLQISELVGKLDTAECRETEDVSDAMGKQGGEGVGRPYRPNGDILIEDAGGAWRWK